MTRLFLLILFFFLGIPVFSPLRPVSSRTTPRGGEFLCVQEMQTQAEWPRVRSEDCKPQVGGCVKCHAVTCCGPLWIQGLNTRFGQKVLTQEKYRSIIKYIYIWLYLYYFRIKHLQYRKAKCNEPQPKQIRCRRCDSARTWVLPFTLNPS